MTRAAIIKSLLRSEVSTQTHWEEYHRQTHRSWIYLNTHKGSSYEPSLTLHCVIVWLFFTANSFHWASQRGFKRSQWAAHQSASEPKFALWSWSRLHQQSSFRVEISLHFSLWEKWRPFAQRGLRENKQTNKQKVSHQTGKGPALVALVWTHRGHLAI